VTTKTETHIFNLVFAFIGSSMLGVAGWIGLSASRIPVIEEKIDSFIIKSDETFKRFDGKMDDHENRIRSLERKR
jgi:phage-related protein